MPRTTYDRPIPATLQVHLDNGESWEATPDDLAKFGYTNPRETYGRVSHALRDALMEAGLLPSGDLTDAEINPFRALFETTVYQGEKFSAETLAAIVEIERTLVQAKSGGSAAA